MCAIGPPKQLTSSFAKARKTSSADPVRSLCLIGTAAVIRSIVMPRDGAFTGISNTSGTTFSILRRLEICHQAHEPLVLVILMVAVEQRRPRVIRNEIDLDRAEARHVDGIFQHAGGRLVADLGDLEGVAMQMDGVVVAALVGHREAIALSGLSSEQR